jgi:hypothetical protein
MLLMDATNYKCVSLITNLTYLQILLAKYTTVILNNVLILEHTNTCMYIIYVALYTTVITCIRSVGCKEVKTPPFN